MRTFAMTGIFHMTRLRQPVGAAAYENHVRRLWNRNGNCIMVDCWMELLRRTNQGRKDSRVGFNYTVRNYCHHLSTKNLCGIDAPSTAQEVLRERGGTLLGTSLPRR